MASGADAEWLAAAFERARRSSGALARRVAKECTDPAWALLFDALWRNASKARVTSIVPAWVAKAEGSSHRPALLACTLRHRAAFVTFDAAVCAPWKEAARQLAEPDGSIEWGLVRVRELVAAAHEDAADHARALAARGGEERSVDAVTEGTALRALALLERGDPTEGLRIARRAARMARAEGVLELEYLANLTLARARRYVGQPSAATRILGCLRRVCPPIWSGWLAWELLWTQQLDAARRALEASDAPASQSAQVALDAVTCASAGDTGGLADAARRLRSCADAWPMIRHESELLLRALDWRSDPHDALHAWARGATLEAPPALRGLARSAIVVAADGPARRVLGAGAGLIGAVGREFLEETAGAHPRARAIIARLALAGADGVSSDALFEGVFGVRRSARHAGAFRTAVYRARQLLGDHGAIVRTTDGLRLDRRATFAVMDPACRGGIEEQVLVELARRGGRASARELAEPIDVPLRTLQKLLTRLVEEGAIGRLQRERSVLYVLEDTTFSDPSLTRLAAGEPAPAPLK